MKVDLVYPKIPENTNGFLDKCIAFEKYDGTNMHWCWDSVHGWHAFGTRRTQFPFTRAGLFHFNETHPELANAPQVFNEDFRDDLTAMFSSNVPYKLNNITVFMEFFGPDSFAGAHSEEDAKADLQELVLFDVMIHGKLIPPNQFIEDFSYFNIAKVIYKGKYTGQFTEDVRKGKYDVNEGVVCKGMVESEVFMTKVKTNDYLKRLKNR